MLDISDLKICETNFVGYGDDRPAKADDEWVIRQLKRYGNCFCDKRHNFKVIELSIGEIRKTPYENGFIVEVVK